MIDFSIAGEAGLIIQFEDIVSMVGFNIARYLKLKNVESESLRNKSLQDLILEYVNREIEDYDEWLSKMFGINISIDSYIDSVNAFQPSWLYAYKVFRAASDNGKKNLYIHSNREIPFIQKHLLPTFNNSSVKYIHGDIVPILNQHPNITYLTSLPTNIRRCLEVDAPFVLTIVDDYMYTAGVLQDKIPEALEKKNVLIRYTSIFSSGFIDNIK